MAPAVQLADVRTWVIDRLTVQIYGTDEELGRDAAAAAAAAIHAAVQARGVANVMFATGNSQLAFLDALTARTDIDWAAHELSGPPHEIETTIGVGVALIASEIASENPWSVLGAK